MSKAHILITAALAFGVTACSSKEPDGPIVEYYYPAYRQFAPEPVYSRLSWSHLPQPIHPKSKDNSPLLMPTLAIDLPRSTLGEAIQALAQTMGYTWTYPQDVAGRTIAIKMTGSVDEILGEIGRQARVLTVLDNESRMVRVVTLAGVGSGSGSITPEAKLPGAGS